MGSFEFWGEWFDVDFGLIFVHFHAFVAGTDSLSEVVNLGTLLNRRMGV